MFVLFVFRVTQLFANCCSSKKQNKKYDVLPEIPPNGKNIDVKLRRHLILSVRRKTAGKTSLA